MKSPPRGGDATAEPSCAAKGAGPHELHPLPNLTGKAMSMPWLSEPVQLTLLAFVIVLSALQHASLLLSIDYTATSGPFRLSWLLVLCDASNQTVWFGYPSLALLMASTAVSVTLLAFLLHTRRVWPTLLAFALHLDLLALTLALHYGIASEFFLGLAWVPVLFFVLGHAPWALLSVACFLVQGWAVHQTLSALSRPPTFELTSGAKLVCCGFGLLAVGGAAFILHSPTKRSPSHSSEAKSTTIRAELLSLLGREIQAPLQGILSLASQVVDSLPSRLWIERECVQRIADSTHVALCLMDNVLDFSTMSSSQLALQSVSFSIIDEFNHVVNILKPAAFKKQILLELIINVRYPHRFGDPRRFRQILFNIVSNAIKYSHEKGSVRITLMNTRVPRNQIEVRVDDSGIGISHKSIANLFDLPQFNGDTKSTGTVPGLGLAISKLLCEAMNGSIRCESKQGVGSSFVFSVEIPVLEQAKQKAVRSKSAESLHGRPTKLGHHLYPSDDTDSNSSSAHSDNRSRVRSRRHSTHNIIAAHKKRSHSSQVKIDDVKQALQDLQEHVTNQNQNNTAPSVAIDSDDSTRSKAVNSGVSSGIKQLLERADKKYNSKSVFKSSEKLSDSDSEADLVDAFSPSALASSSGSIPTGNLGDESIGMIDKRELLRRRRSENALFTDELSGHSRRSKQRQPELLGVRVLVVEDNRVNQKVAKLMLSSLGCKVELADNGKAGFELIAEKGNEYDVILMDLQMPVMDGFISTTKIREHERALGLPRTPIVSLTASTTSEYRDRCYACGMDDWLSKPFNKDQLITVLLLWAKRPTTSPTCSSSPSSPSSSPHSYSRCLTSPEQSMSSPLSPPSDDHEPHHEHGQSYRADVIQSDIDPIEAEALGKDQGSVSRTSQHDTAKNACQYHSGEHYRREERPSYNRSSSA